MATQFARKREPVVEILPAEDRRVAPELELLAHWMDTVFHVPGVGIRFGLDAIIGLIPGVGDAITSVVSLYILTAARRYGVSRITLTRMALNIAIDSFVGSIPFVGDAFDVYWKANKKNVALLRNHLQATPQEQRRAVSQDRLFVAVLVLALVALLVGSVTVMYLLITWAARLLFH